MSRLQIVPPAKHELVLDDINRAVLRRLRSGNSLLCPVDMVAAYLRLFHAQSCGKCVPCRIGLGQLQTLVESVLEGEADENTLISIERTAQAIKDSSDCAIGFEAANVVLRSLKDFRDDFLTHINEHHCSVVCQEGVPCKSYCPANVDIPEYIALVAEGRFADAVRVIRRDNPFPSVCGFICEHPCENKCRRKIVDDSLNIRGLKRYATDNAGIVEPPACLEATGKRIAIVGGGPAGLTAAYFLNLMGHTTEVFEKREKLGGMLRYGIPRYRLPAEQLDRDIEAILKTGTTVHFNAEIGKGTGVAELRETFDSVYIAIGAHSGKKMRIPGEDGPNVIPAIQMLGELGSGIFPDYTGKTVCVVGGGNVAMDAARSAVRAGATRVNIVYRRRRQDMTALPEEVDGAVSESCELITFTAPDSVERDENGNVTALIGRPQRVGKLDASGRPAPLDSGLPNRRIPCDIVLVAIGQAVDSAHFGSNGIPLSRDAISAGNDTAVYDIDGVFSGGDCVTGPATVIKAIAAGKVAAANIDAYLGYKHELRDDIAIPPVGLVDVTPFGRANMTERECNERKNDYEPIECPLDCAMAQREAQRCLRCDHFGYAPYWEDRRRKW